MVLSSIRSPCFFSGHCCVMYQVCPGDADAFTLDGEYETSDPPMSDADATCVSRLSPERDFIGIEGLKITSKLLSFLLPSLQMIRLRCMSPISSFFQFKVRPRSALSQRVQICSKSFVGTSSPSDRKRILLMEPFAVSTGYTEHR